MPIYEYQCERCGYRFDQLQKVSDPPPTACPECGDPRVRRLISAVGFRLKGGGWYETDFKTGNQRNLHDTGEKPSGEPKGKSAGEGKSEAKSAGSESSAPSTGSAGAGSNGAGTPS